MYKKVDIIKVIKRNRVSMTKPDKGLLRRFMARPPDIVIVSENMPKLDTKPLLDIIKSAYLKLWSKLDGATHAVSDSISDGAAYHLAEYEKVHLMLHTLNAVLLSERPLLRPWKQPDIDNIRYLILYDELAGLVKKRAEAFRALAPVKTDYGVIFTNPVTEDKYTIESIFGEVSINKIGITPPDGIRNYLSGLENMIRLLQ